MKISVAKPLAAALLTLGLAGGTAGLTTATASASPAPHETALHETALKHATTAKKKTTPTKKTAPAKKLAAPKAGQACTKAELNKTEKSGKTTLACERSGKGFKWTVKKAAKVAAKKTAKAAKK